MGSNKWDSLSKPDRAKLLESAGLPTGLAQLKWSGLQKSERKKLEKGSGWFEAKEPIMTAKGIEHKAPEHHKVAIKKEAGKALNKPMGRKEEKEVDNGQTEIKIRRECAGIIANTLPYRDALIKKLKEEKLSERRYKEWYDKGFAEAGTKSSIYKDAKSVEEDIELVKESNREPTPEGVYAGVPNMSGLESLAKLEGIRDGLIAKAKKAQEQKEAAEPEEKKFVNGILKQAAEGATVKEFGTRLYIWAKGEPYATKHITDSEYEALKAIIRGVHQQSRADALKNLQEGRAKEAKIAKEIEQCKAKEQTDIRTDAQILKDLEIEYNSSNRRALKELTQREREAIDKDIIRKYPITSAYIGALTTISGTQDKELKSFDKTVREESEKTEHADKIPNGYKLVSKDYQREKYEREFMKGGVNIVVAMQYHTTRKYWHVNILFTYEPHFRTEVVDGLEYTKSRKEARDYAFNAMKKNPEEYYTKLSPYYQNLITESLKKPMQNTVHEAKQEEAIKSTKEAPAIEPEYKRVKYIVIDRLTGNVVHDAQIGGKTDSYLKRKQVIDFIQNPNNIYGDRYVVKVEGSTSPGLTINEIYDEYEFKKYGRPKGKWGKPKEQAKTTSPEPHTEKENVYSSFREKLDSATDEITKTQYVNHTLGAISSAIKDTKKDIKRYNDLINENHPSLDVKQVKEQIIQKQKELQGFYDNFLEIKTVAPEYSGLPAFKELEGVLHKW